MGRVIKVYDGKSGPYLDTPYTKGGGKVVYNTAIFSEADKRAEEIGYYRNNSIGFYTDLTNVSYLGGDFKIVKNKMFSKGIHPRLTLRFQPTPENEDKVYYFFRPLHRVLKWVTVKGDVVVGLPINDRRFFDQETNLKFPGGEFFVTLGKKKLGVVEVTYMGSNGHDITDTFLLRGLFCAQITHELGKSLGKLIEWAEGDNLASLYMALMMLDKDEVIRLEKEMLGQTEEEPPIERPQVEVN